MTQRPESYLRYANDDVFDALEALEREALARGVSMAGLATAWLLDPRRSPPSSSARRGAEHLEPVREALALDLTPADRDHLRGLFA